jgi:hypothetical protein
MAQAKPNLEGDLAEFDDGHAWPTSGKATASLVLGLCSVFACCIGPPPFILAGCCIGIPALVFGLLALRDISNPKKWVKGTGTAIAGIALGCLSMVVLVLAVLGAEGREPSRRAMCVNNLKQIALAMHNYCDAHRTFPAAAIADKNGRPVLSWRVALLPYLDSAPLHAKFHLDEPWDSPHNKPLADQMPPIFGCPSEPSSSRNLTTYVVVVDPHSIFTGEPSGIPISRVSDGTSSTFLVVEAASPVPWTRPADLSLASLDQPLGVGSKHSAGFNAVMADGSPRFIRTSGDGAISPQVLRALVTRDGHEAVSVP